MVGALRERRNANINEERENPLLRFYLLTYLLRKKVGLKCIQKCYKVFFCAQLHFFSYMVAAAFDCSLGNTKYVCGFPFLSDLAKNDK